MDEVIQRILSLAGPMPDVEGHARYLRKLAAGQLFDREQALRDMRPDPNQKIEFWRARKKTAPLPKPEVAA
jgi:hypothetical protein